MKSTTLDELARLIGGRVEGDGNCVISGVAPIESAKTGDISFLSNPIYIKYADSCGASALIVSPEVDLSFRPLLLAENPYLLFAKAVEFFHQDQNVPEIGIDPRALVDRTAEIGEEVAIMAGAVVEADAAIGKNSVLFPGVYVREGSVLGERCLIYPRVTIERHCALGNHVILHSGTVIGDWSRLLPFDETEEESARPGVEIGDEVELGSNVIVSRGHAKPTRIAAGTKMDNLVQIGSEAEIGRACLVVAQAGIGDGCVLEDGVTIAGQVTVEPGVTVGQRAIIAARSLVTQKVPPGRVYSGIPARPHIHEKRILACIGKLPSLYRRIQDLEERINPENHR